MEVPRVRLVQISRSQVRAAAEPKRAITIFKAGLLSAKHSYTGMNTYTHKRSKSGTGQFDTMSYN